MISNGQVWLVCGGRDFTNAAMFKSAMDDLISAYGRPSTVVHGDAAGADAMADHWARQLALQVIPVKANWQAHGKAAGAIRNQKMLDRYRPHFVIAFPGGKGTADMVRRARAVGIKVAEIQPTPPLAREKEETE